MATKSVKTKPTTAYDVLCIGFAHNNSTYMHFVAFWEIGDDDVTWHGMV